MTNNGARIEDYAFLSDTQTGALVSREGCVDWLCFPRFDSGACFASLLGKRENGCWRFFPREKIEKVRRRYRDATLILETEIETASGTVRFIDFMPPRGKNPGLHPNRRGGERRSRVANGTDHSVRLRPHCAMGAEATRRTGSHRRPDGLILRTPIKTHGKDLTTVAEFTVKKGERVPFVLTWFESQEEPPKPVTADHALRDTENFGCAGRISVSQKLCGMTR